MSFKINILKRSELTIPIMFVISVFVFSYLILLFDIDTLFQSATEGIDSPFFLAIYQIVITMTTVGYGDICPGNMMGRIVAMTCALWG